LLFLNIDASLFASSNQSCKYLISFFDFQGTASIFSCHFIYHSAWSKFLYIKSLVSNGTFSLFISGVLTVDSFFATIDFFSGTTVVDLNADSVVAFGFAFGTIGGFTESDTIGVLELLARPSPADLLRGVIVLPRLTRRVTFGFLLRL